MILIFIMPSLFRRIGHVLKLCDKVLGQVFYFQEDINIYIKSLSTASKKGN